VVSVFEYCSTLCPLSQPRTTSQLGSFAKSTQAHHLPFVDTRKTLLPTRCSTNTVGSEPIILVRRFFAFDDRGITRAMVSGAVSSIVAQVGVLTLQFGQREPTLGV
jgi:hypothetical protein